MKTDLLRTRAVIALTVVITLIAGFMPVYGTDDAPAADSQTEQTTPESTDAAADRELSEEEKAIEKYGYYKGKNAKKIPVLTYHVVASDNEAARMSSSLIIAQSKFDRQMKWLHKRNYRTVNCDEFYLWYKGKIKLPPKTVMITFDDGYPGVVKYGLPVLKKYKMKGTFFIVGKLCRESSNMVSYKQIKKLSKSQDLLEFQSHTYNLHTRTKALSGYATVKKDAKKQKKLYGFEYLAYPYGYNNSGMRRAYKDTGIKLAFTYGNDTYATRKQDIYRIERIKIYANGSMDDFKSWFAQ